MEITITEIKFYPNRYWFWYFKKFKFIKGFIIRIFGIDIRISENNSMLKLIAKAKLYNIENKMRV